MKVFGFLKRFAEKYLFNRKWKCLSCGKEIFDGDFCKDCEKALPIIGENRCAHCGRKTASPVSYCLTCKGRLTETDKCLSVFNYEEPISRLIKKLKYYNGRYLAETFSEYLFKAYKDSGITADAATFVPMTARAEKKRRFNQSRLLAEKFSGISGLPLIDVLIKAKETERQAKLSAAERRKNLLSAFRVKDRKSVKGKSVVIIDDVSTTGTTGETIAQKLKRAGAAKVYLLTVASVQIEKINVPKAGRKTTVNQKKK